MPEVDQFITVRMPRDLHKQLSLLAKRNERTIAAEIRLAVRERLEADAAEEAFAVAREASQ